MGAINLGVHAFNGTTGNPMTDDVTPPSRRYSGSFVVGDRVRLTGPKAKMHTLTLKHGAEFHSHRGFVKHDDIIGAEDGSVILSSSGEQYLALRPLLSDFVMSMPRGAAIVYPKDAAQILALADIYPGATVLEAGVGSGALSMWLLRAIGPAGQLISIERREEFAEIALDNVASFYGATPPNWQVTVGSFEDEATTAFGPGAVDRVVLDMLAPWECVDACGDVLKPGGVVICYVATVTQLSRTVEAFRASGQFTQPESSETMVRGWHVEGLAVRPDHRMVAHTGFLTVARRLAPDTVLPELKRRASKSDFDESDVLAWTPDAVGIHEKSGKALKKNLKRANTMREETGAQC